MSTDDEKREALARNMHRLATEGMDAATEAAIQILADPKAPSQARSATINAVFRSQGLFDRKDDPDDEKEPHEMTAAELNRAVKDLTRSLNRARDSKGDDGGVFD
ncbi:hypothetical protein ATO8_09753 [Roseivivax marinus]|uniref:Uncharacterized protein n=1 Tax=Roseivivax marinus TaxID=1379903 RepID=W4HK70_9RHOB|nr:hypothetical protein [Roseivivax marinus]ETW12818.1 hypothetical protein ATO8_09753 [Roseivivax marinus]